MDCARPSLLLFEFRQALSAFPFPPLVFSRAPLPDENAVAVRVGNRDFAALDGLAQKVLDLRMKQYGDKSKEQQVIDKRVQNARVIASVLTREITLK